MTAEKAKHRSGRRGNHEGSIRQRPGGKWEARVSLPDGKRKSYYGETRMEVARKLTAAQRTLDQGMAIHTGRLTVGQFLDRWMEDVIRVKARHRSYLSYQSTIRLHIVPRLGGQSLERLTAQQVQAFLNQVSKAVSPHMAGYCRDILRSALNRAIRWKLVAFNAAAATEPPRVTRRVAHPLTREDARAILAAFAGSRLETLVTVGLALGLRRGEMLGLRWRDVDLDAATLEVRHQVQREDDRWVFVEPKSEAGKRTLPLPAFLVTALREHRTRQLEERLRAGPLWQDYDLAFPTSIGTPQYGSTVWAAFQQGLKKAGLPPMPLHHLRHGAATMLLAQGATQRGIMAVLGHSNISTTMNIYTHVAPDLLRANAERMQRALGGE